MIYEILLSKSEGLNELTILSSKLATILITGGSGFIGFHLAKHMAKKGNNVTIIDNLSRGRHDLEFENLLQVKNVNFLKIDLTNYEEIKQIDSDYDYAYHLAAVNGTKYFYEMPEKLLKINIL